MKMFTVKNLKKLSVAVCALGIFAGAVVLPVIDEVERDEE